MAPLPSPQREVVGGLVKALSDLPGLCALSLCGSHARGHALSGSDVDLGLLYSESEPFSIEAVRKIARQANDSLNPVVTEFGEWGPWVNGGAWLRVRGQRVDLLYRSVEQVERVLTQARRGEYEIHAGQQPPYGYFGPTVLGEVAVCEPLHDPEGILSALKARVLPYPEALRRAVVQDSLWGVEFGIGFAEKFAARSGPYGATGCLARLTHQLVLTLFALNRVYLQNDKTALAEIAGFADAPSNFASRASALLARPGTERAELEHSVAELATLFREVASIASDLYLPRYPLPG